MRPTPRSVTARQPNKSFDDGWRDDGFWSAMMIRTFPRNAVMEWGIVNAEMIILWSTSRCLIVLQDKPWIAVSLSFTVRFTIFISRFDVPTTISSLLHSLAFNIRKVSWVFGPSCSFLIVCISCLNTAVRPLVWTTLLINTKQSVCKSHNSQLRNNYWELR